MNKILVTGPNGFVGQALCRELVTRKYPVRIALRSTASYVNHDVEIAKIGDLTADTDWTEILGGVQTIIHLAARVHITKEYAKSPLDEFRKANVYGMENLARTAAVQGVKRFVYVSSIGVNGLQTSLDRSFQETDDPAPHNVYALSKWEAEQCLERIAAQTELEIVIVRPPLVYGADAPGNFAKMMQIILKGIPLPLASIRNLRSLVYVGNLVDALITCAVHPAAAGHMYLVSDAEDISTPHLFRGLASAMGRPARLFPCSPTILKLAGKMTGKSDQIERLIGSLRIDSTKIKHELGWRPPYSMQDGLRITGERAISTYK